jgi:hypothetical protein
MTTSLSLFLGRLCGLAALSVTLLTGCGKQGEGERCSILNGNQDCEGSLICVRADDLRSSDDVSRCCPSDASSASDSRCARLTGTGNGNNPMSGGGQGGEAPTSRACEYDSECSAGMKCGSQGSCIAECLTDRDCGSGEICTAQGACTPSTNGAGGAE